MKRHGTKFGRKKEAAIAARLTHRNIEEAAKAVGISSPTLIAWMKVSGLDPFSLCTVVKDRLRNRSLRVVTLVGHSALLDRTPKTLSHFPGEARLTRYEEGVSHRQFRLPGENVTNRV